MTLVQRPFARTTWVSQHQNVSSLDFTGGWWRWVVTAVAIICAKLQSNRHHQHTNITQTFYRLDALPVTQPTASEHWRKLPNHKIAKWWTFNVNFRTTWQREYNTVKEDLLISERDSSSSDATVYSVWPKVTLQETHVSWWVSVCLLQQPQCFWTVCLHHALQLTGYVQTVRVPPTHTRTQPCTARTTCKILDIAPFCSESLPQKCSGMARVLKGSHSFTCTPTRSSAVGMSNTYLCLPSYGRYSFTDPKGWKAE